MGGFFQFTKADRRVMTWILIAGLVCATVLVFVLSPKAKDESKRIELPEHWWEKKK